MDELRAALSVDVGEHIRDRSHRFAEDSFPFRAVEAKGLRGLSAVGYCFGQGIHVSQRIPIGLIFIIKAGSQAEQWLDHDTLHSLFDVEQLQTICSGSHLAAA